MGGSSSRILILILRLILILILILIVRTSAGPKFLLFVGPTSAIPYGVGTANLFFRPPAFPVYSRPGGEGGGRAYVCLRERGVRARSVRLKP